MKYPTLFEVLDALFQAPFDSPLGAVWKHNNGILLNRKFAKCEDGEGLYYWSYDGKFRA